MAWEVALSGKKKNGCQKEKQVWETKVSSSLVTQSEEALEHLGGGVQEAGREI